MDNEVTNLGEKIALARKNKGLTQEQLAEMVKVSSQAVSKWENSITSPDISILPILAKIFGTTIDALLDNSISFESTKINNKKNGDDSSKSDKIKNYIIRIVAKSDDDKVDLKLPLSLLKVASKVGMAIPNVNEKLKGIDIEAILNAATEGVEGKILDVDSTDGSVEIYLESSK